jgi:ribonuclease HI
MFDAACLAYFDPNKEVFVEADASGVGLGACILQRDKEVECPPEDVYYNLRPVAFTSKSLTPCETRYSNIERELLAVVYAMERFHIYTYAQQVHVLTDHKLLESIYKKGFTQCTTTVTKANVSL